MKTTSRVLLTVAAAGMALSPVAAHANTRAGDSNTTYSAPASQPGEGRNAEGEGVIGSGAIAAFLAAAAAVGIILIIDDDDDQSPGA